MQRDRFALALYDPEHDGEVVSCRDYLGGREEGALAWRPDPEDSALLLSTGGVDWLSNNWNLGNLSLLVRQLAELASRLGRNELGILRSAVLEQPTVPYFVFEPAEPEDLVRISLIYLLDPGLGRLFPLEDETPRGYERLKAFFAAHRRDLLRADPFPDPARPRLSEVPYPRAALLRALEEEVELGRRVLSLL